MQLDDKLCYCFHISKRKIVNYVKRERPRRASQISECFGAGTGCGWCIPFLRKIHQEIVAGDIVEADDVTASEYEAMRAGYRQDVTDGTRERNRHSGTNSCPGDPLGDDIDVTSYFSRGESSEPEPDKLD
jgi:NAD(P)H-nitrite reductase large subunit